MKEERQPGDQKESLAEETVERNYGEQPRSHRKQRKRVRALPGIVAVRDLLRMVLLLVFLIASLVTDKTGVCELAMILR